MEKNYGEFCRRISEIIIGYIPEKTSEKSLEKLLEYLIEGISDGILREIYGGILFKKLKKVL